MGVMGSIDPIRHFVSFRIVLAGQVSAVQQKWYARRFNIIPFNKAFDGPGRVFLFFTVNYSSNFQVGIFLTVILLASAAGQSRKPLV